MRKRLSVIGTAAVAAGLVLGTSLPASAATFTTGATQSCPASAAFLSAKSTGNLSITTIGAISTGTSTWSNGGASIQRTRSAGTYVMYAGSHADTTATFFANAYPGCYKVA